jgi:hypothetical protein
MFHLKQVSTYLSRCQIQHWMFYLKCNSGFLYSCQWVLIFYIDQSAIQISCPNNFFSYWNIIIFLLKKNHKKDHIVLVVFLF